MAVALRTPDQIDAIKRAGLVVAEMHEACARVAEPGARTGDLDATARTVLADHGASSDQLGREGFPAVACVSPNDVVVCGVPGADVVLEEGDILGVDCGAVLAGWRADAAITIAVGEVDDESRRLMAVTRAALEAAIERVRAGDRVRCVGAAAEDVVTAAGFSVVRAPTGHGVGRAASETELRPGMVLRIEAMAAAGGSETRILEDGWTVVTRDGSRSAHFGHTVAVTADGYRVLTLPW